jgi:DNA-binding transcriptional ArsR family regulator
VLAKSSRAEIAALRALAHPLRLRLLELAAAEDTVTTALASARTGESSGNCSFHLRLLARHGFLTSVDGRDRREHPWRLAERPPLADLWSRLAVSSPVDDGLAELMRNQLRIFDPNDLDVAA